MESGSSESELTSLWSHFKAGCISTCLTASDALDLEGYVCNRASVSYLGFLSSIEENHKVVTLPDLAQVGLRSTS